MIVKNIALEINPYPEIELSTAWNENLCEFGEKRILSHWN